MEQKEKAIGVFDSGLGGLTTVRELSELLPREDIVYFGDTGRVPYGTRSRETINRYAAQDIQFLLRHQVKVIIAACGTVSAVLDPAVQSEIPVPFTGVLLPAAQAAAKATRNGRIGVIGTAATIASGAYRQALVALDASFNVASVACPLFVPLVENGYFGRDCAITRLAAEEYLVPLKDQGIDTLIMGCTHYPLIAPVIADILGPDVALIDPGKVTAGLMKTLLAEQELLAGRAGGSVSYYVSDSTEGFEQNAQLFLGGRARGTVERVDVDTL